VIQITLLTPNSVKNAELSYCHQWKSQKSPRRLYAEKKGAEIILQKMDGQEVKGNNRELEKGI
jgi:hypothetical protein